MEWKRHCPGYTAYRWQDDGRIEVENAGFEVYEAGSPQDKLAKKVFGTYSSRCIAWSKTRGFPAAWIGAIITIESQGNPYACSPCVEGPCSYAKSGKCGGGPGADGKNYLCCGYGLMQIVDVNAKSHGLKHGGELMGNVEESLRIGTEMFRKLLIRGEGDPLMAAKYYNGCRKETCKGGKMLKCIKGCKFGIGGQNSYAEKFVKYANMFVGMFEAAPGGVPGGEPGGTDPGGGTGPGGEPGGTGPGGSDPTGPGAFRFSSEDLSEAGSSLAAALFFAGLAYSAFKVAQSVIVPALQEV